MNTKKKFATEEALREVLYLTFYGVHITNYTTERY